MHLMSVQRAFPNNCCEQGFGPPISGRDAFLKAGGWLRLEACEDLGWPIFRAARKVGLLESMASMSTCPPFSPVPVRSSIPACPDLSRLPRASRGSDRDPIGARSETDTLFTLSLQGLSLSIQTTYR